MSEATRGTAAITGASGFVGASIARHLSARGWRLRLLVRPASLSRLPDIQDAEPVVGTLTDPAALQHLVAGADAVVHCAGAVRGVSYDDFARTNVAGTQCLMRALEPHTRVIHISSLAARHPSLSHYAASKRAAERCVLDGVGDGRRVLLRPPAIYGPADRELRPLLDAMSRGFALLPGHPDARFSLLHVDDLARAVGELLDTEAGWGRIHEPDDGHPGGYRWRDVTAAVARATGKPVRTLRVPPAALSVLGAGNEWWSRLAHRAPMLTRGKARELRHMDWVASGNASLAGTAWRPTIDLDVGVQALFDASASTRADR